MASTKAERLLSNNLPPSSQAKLFASYGVVSGAIDVVSDGLIRGPHALAGIPDVLRGTTHDFILAFYMAAMIAMLTLPVRLKSNVLLGSAASFLILSSIEAYQGVLQHYGYIDRGYSPNDYVAYALGVLALPVVHFATTRATRLWGGHSQG